jgi:alpha-ketoglutarate-dependent taurine dioxygenase
MVEIRRMGPQIGVEVTGVDVKALDDAGFAPIYQAWLDYNILVVRDQELEIRDFLRYSRRFGPVVPRPSKSTRHPEIPEITMLGINKFDADGKLNNAIYRRGARAGTPTAPTIRRRSRRPSSTRWPLRATAATPCSPMLTRLMTRCRSG